MFLLAAAWLYYLAVFVVLGAGAVQLVWRVSAADLRDAPVRSFHLPWLGFAVISVLASLWSLFWRVHVEFWVLISMLAVATAWWTRDQRIAAVFWKATKNLHALTVLTLASTTLMILFAGTDGPVYNLDPGRYHFQNMLWAETFPAVPGLANLHHRFGLSSSWYLLHALADWGPLEHRSYHVFNSLFLALIAAYGIVCVERVVRGARDSESLFTVACLGFVVWYYDLFRYLFLSCLTPDLPVNLLVLVFCHMALDAWNRGGGPGARLTRFIHLGLVASQAVAVRTSGAFLALPLLLLGLDSVRLRRLSLPQVAGALVLAAVLTLPTLARSFILSGWPLYPSAALGWIEPGWRYPDTSRADLMRAIQTFAFMETIQPDEFRRPHHIRTPLPLLFLGWLYGALSSFGFVYWVLLGLVFALWLRLRARNALDNGLVGTSLLMAMAWMGTSPHFRYGFGYVAAAFAVPAGVALARSGVSRATLATLASVLAASTVVNVTLKTSGVSLRESRLGYPVAVLRQMRRDGNPWLLRGVPAARWRAVALGSVTVHITQRDVSYVSFGRHPGYVPHYFPEAATDAAGFERPTWNAGYNAAVSTMNWLAPLPATTSMPPGLELRGRSVRSGFRISPEGRPHP